MAEDISAKRRIKLHIYDEDMELNVPYEKEGYYRDCAKIINDAINLYAGHFKGKKSDKQILYMAFIDIAERYVEEHQKHNEIPFVDMLSKLTSEIDDALK